MLKLRYDQERAGERLLLYLNVLILRKVTRGQRSFWKGYGEGVLMFLVDALFIYPPSSGNTMD